MSKISDALQKAMQERNKSDKDSKNHKKIITRPLADVPAKIRKILKKNIVFLNNETEGAAASQESFRILRTNLQAGMGRRKSILVTSADVGDGKSFVALNLAVSMAQSGNRVLLVDINVDHPQLAGRLGVDNIPGLMEVLSVGSKWQDIVKNTAIHGLDIIPAGYPLQNHSEILSGPQMVELIKEWEKSFDIVIIDSGSIATDSDSLLVAPAVKGAIIVARLNRTKKDDLASAKHALLQVDAKLIGYVTTDVSDIVPSFIGKYI